MISLEKKILFLKNIIKITTVENTLSMEQLFNIIYKFNKKVTIYEN